MPKVTLESLAVILVDVQSRMQAMELRMSGMESRMATKEDLKKLELSTKEDIRQVRSDMATKDDLSKLKSEMATKDDLSKLKSDMATRGDLNKVRSEMATKDDLYKLDLKVQENLQKLESSRQEDMRNLEERIVAGVNEIIQTQTDYIDKRFKSIQRQLGGLQAAIARSADVYEHEALEQRVTALEKAR